MAALALIGGLVSAVGTVAQASAMSQQAKAEQQAANYKATIERQQAQEERASAQRKAFDKQRQTGLVQSQLQARAAASGGGAADPTVVNLSEDIAGQGAYQSLIDMWKGESRARGLENQADADIYSGNMRASALRSSATGTLLGGFSSLFSTFGKAYQSGSFTLPSGL